MVNHKIRSFTGLNFNQWAWPGIHIGEISVKVSCRITMAELHKRFTHNINADFGETVCEP